MKTKDKPTEPKKKTGSGSKGASKKSYHANGPSILERNNRRRTARVARKAAYWQTVAGQARKLEKMNTPAKLKKLADWKLARDARRVESRKK